MRETNQKTELFYDTIPLMKVSTREKISKPFILTNGPSDSQRSKFKTLGLFRYIQRIYISEEIGFRQAQPKSVRVRFYEIVDAAASDVLMVGDSIENDIDGAEQAGIKAVLIDRGKIHSGYTGTKIGTLSEVIKLL